MEIEHILVVFESPDGENLWKPVDRELIPDWLRTPEIFDRMLAGEKVINTEEREHRYFTVMEVDRPRPAGTRAARAVHAALAEGRSPGGIALIR